MDNLAVVPTESRWKKRLADFPTLVEALDYASLGVNGMTIYDARGRVTETCRWADLREASLQVAGRLLARGLVPGDRVAILAETSPNFVATFMGCLYAGLVPCPTPLPAAFGARSAYGETLRALTETANAQAIVAPGMFGDRIAEAFGDREMVFAGGFGELDNEPCAVPPADPAADDLAYLQFSSGTTRSPRGVAVSHAAMMANISGIVSHLGVTDQDRGMSWLPWYHDMGLVGCVLLPIACQMDIDYLATRDFMVRPGLWLHLIDRNRCTISYSPSFGYELAARRARPSADLDLSCWRIAGVGGDMVRPGTLSGFAEAFAPVGFRQTAFMPSYGMAEATLGLTFGERDTGIGLETVDAERLADEGVAERPRPDRRQLELVRCGRPLPGHRIEVRDDRDNVVSERRIGRVFAAGPSLMQGYFREPEETARVLNGDGWLDTGDLGYLIDGELVITGRSKDVLMVNGRNVWPQEIEWSVEAHVDGVRTGGVAVFGVSRSPEDLDSGRIAVVVECRTVDPDLRDAMRRNAHAVVREAHGIAADVALCAPRALPRTTSGKLRRDEVRRMFLAGEFEL